MIYLSSAVYQHCTWLNTCVGARNYVYFFALVVTGAAQMLYQTAIGVMYMTLWRDDAEAIPDRSVISCGDMMLFYSLSLYYCCCVI
jgi:hypothetical protein